MHSQVPHKDCHPDVLAFHEYWESKRSGRKMPSRADIDPIEMKRFLPGVMLIDVVADTRRYVYRLIGTREVSVRGNDPTGKSIFEGFFGPSLDAAMSLTDQIVTTRAPLFLHRTFTAPDGRPGDEEFVMAPLSDDGRAVNMIVAHTHHRLFE